MAAVATLSPFERAALARLAGRADAAAKAIAAWAQHPTLCVHVARDLVNLAQLSVGDEAAVAEVLAAGVKAGLWVDGPHGFVPVTTAEALTRLSLCLAAIDDYRRVTHRDETSVQVVLTKPAPPCVLEESLRQSGWRVYALDETEVAFRRIVQQAQHRVVVMTPFFDGVGALRLRELFTDLPAALTKVLVLRSLEEPSRSDYPVGYDYLVNWLLEQRVEVYNYSLVRPAGGGRETFHAKVVLCDDTAAYVGSSNVNAASLEHSMEMGVQLTGKAARHIALVVDAVLHCAERVL